MLGYGSWTAALELGDIAVDLGKTSGSCGWEMSVSSTANIDAEPLSCEGLPELLDAPVDELALSLHRDGVPMWRGTVDALDQDVTGERLSISASDWTSQSAGYHIGADVAAPTQRNPGGSSWTPEWDVAEFAARALSVARVPDDYVLLAPIGVPVAASVAFDDGTDIAQLLAAIADVVNWTVINGRLSIERPYSASGAGDLAPAFSAVPSWWITRPSVRRSAAHVTRVTARSTTAFDHRRRPLEATVIDEVRERAGRRHERIIASAFRDIGTLAAAAASTLDSMQETFEIGAVSLAAKAEVDPLQLRPGLIGEIATGTWPMSYDGPCSIARVAWQWKRGRESESASPSVTFVHPTATRRTRPYGTRTIGSIAADHERRLRSVEANGTSAKAVEDAINTTSDLMKLLAPLGLFDVQ